MKINSKWPVGLLLVLSFVCGFLFFSRTPVSNTNKEKKINSLESQTPSGHKTIDPFEAPKPIQEKKSAIGTVKVTQESQSTLVSQQPTTEWIANKTMLPAVRASEVQFNARKMLDLANTQEVVTLQLFSDTTLSLHTKTVKTENGFQHINFLVSDNKFAQGTLTTDADGIVVGIIQAPPKAYQIVYSGHKTSYVVEIDHSKIHPHYEKDPNMTAPPLQKQAPLFQKKNSQQNEGSYQIKTKLLDYVSQFVFPNANAESVSFNQPRVIRVKFFHTPEVESANGGNAGLRAMIANQLAVANNAASAAGANFSWEMTSTTVRPGVIVDSLGTYSQVTAINTITNENTPDRFAQVRAEGADLIHFYAAYQGTDSCGIAYIGDYNSWNEPQHFKYNTGVTAHMCNSKYTLAHELGHNLGLDHNYQNSGDHPTKPKAERYNFGFRDETNLFRTIMSYPGGACTEYYNAANLLGGLITNCPVIQSYSNGQQTNTDNARKLREVTNVFFAPPKPSVKMQTFLIMAPYFESTDSLNLDLRPDTNVFTYLSGYTNGYIVPNVMNSSSEFVWKKNGTPIVSLFQNAEYSLPVGPTNDMVAAEGDIFELEIKNKFGMSRARAVARSVTPSLSFTIAGPDENSVHAAGVSLSFALTPSHGPTPACSWKIDNQTLGSGFQFTQTFNLRPNEFAFGSSQFIIEINCTRSTPQWSNESKTIYRQVQIRRPIQIVTQPTGISIAEGTNLMSVSATGYLPTHQWYKVGNPTPLQTSTNSLNSSYMPTSIGSYYVKVFNEVSEVTSTPVEVTNYFKPRFTLTNQTAVEGQAFSYSPTITSNPTATIQWLKNSTEVATGPTFNLGSPLRANEGTYSLSATNVLGTTQNNFVLKVEYKPEITNEPTQKNLTPALGTSVSIAITVGGKPTPTYQWEFTSTTGQTSNLPGQTSSTLALNNIASSQNGVYRLRASNAHGFAYSSNYQINILTPIQITRQPVGGSVLPSGITLTVEATGSNPEFQWMKNNQEVIGATSATLSLNQSSQIGSYKVQVKNTINTVTSNTVEINSNSPPIATLADQTAIEGIAFVYSPPITGEPLPTVTWYKDNTQIRTGISLNMGPMLRAQSGNYKMKAENSLGAIERTFKIEVQYKPEITSEPISKISTLKSQSPFVLNITTGGLPTPTAQWTYKTTPTGVPSPLATLTQPNLNIGSVSWGQMGYYQLVLTNAHGSVKSSDFQLIVEPDKRDVQLPAPESRSMASELLQGNFRIDKTSDYSGGDDE